MSYKEHLINRSNRANNTGNYSNSGRMSRYEQAIHNVFPEIKSRIMSAADNGLRGITFKLIESSYSITSFFHKERVVISKLNINNSRNGLYALVRFYILEHYTLDVQANALSRKIYKTLGLNTWVKGNKVFVSW